MKTLRNKNEKGFTLIELLVVIAIIGLLASVVLLALNSARAKSRDAKRLADVRQIASAFELFFNDVSAYPTGNANYVVVSGGNPAVTSRFGLDGNLFAQDSNGSVKTLTPTYIGLVPQAPTPQDGTCGTTSAGGNTYGYTTSSNSTGSTYTLSFCLGAATGGYVAGVHYLTPAGIQ